MPRLPKARGEICGAVKADGSGDLCQQPAGFGTNHVGIGHCKFHFGATAQHVRAAEVELANRAVANFGLPVQVTPEEALMQELYRSQGHVVWLEDKVGRQTEAELKQRDASNKFERPSVWVEMLWTERKHLAAVAKAIVDCKLGERAAKVAEVQAAALVAVIMNTLSDPSLALNEEQVEQGKRLAASSLRALASGE